MPLPVADAPWSTGRRVSSSFLGVFLTLRLLSAHFHTYPVSREVTEGLDVGPEFRD